MRLINETYIKNDICGREPRAPENSGGNLLIPFPFRMFAARGMNGNEPFLHYFAVFATKGTNFNFEGAAGGAVLGRRDGAALVGGGCKSCCNYSSTMRGQMKGERIARFDETNSLVSKLGYLWL